MTKALRLVLGDQLSQGISSLSDCDKKTDIIFMCEVWEEATYVKHHKKKIAFLFSAMRHFAEELKQAGYRVEYTRLDDLQNAGSFRGEIGRALERFKPQEIIVTEPGEIRVLEDMKQWQGQFSLPVEIRSDDRFLCNLPAFYSWAKERKQLRMEFFYREMRRSYKILMNGDQPEGGEWNYDSENRNPASGAMFIPQPLTFKPDAITLDVIRLVSERFADHFGDLEPFYFAVTRAEALKVLEKFIKERLPDFGTYQDAMLQGQPWMYHSHLSFYINCGLLNPLEVAQAAEAAYRAGKVPLNSAEGFIRQIIGWREYVRGVYWLRAADYPQQNFFEAKRKLPWFYWSGDTKMNCLRQCVTETKQNAYAHHIQRLMVLGNFALLAGIDPKDVNEWFLVVYADAYEWVEMPNVTGMILFADGGYLASKPYAAGGAYINKMSDYCKNCAYKVKEKTGNEACPFNYLYWDFMIRNKDKLENNPRLGMTYRTLGVMEADKIRAIEESAAKFLEAL
jgi:deoxyribodipyrimidine photolyase-related protein